MSMRVCKGDRLAWIKPDAPTRRAYKPHAEVLIPELVCFMKHTLDRGAGGPVRRARRARAQGQGSDQCSSTGVRAKTQIHEMDIELN